MKENKSDRYLVTKSDLKQLQAMTIGERVKWIRTKAYEMDSASYSIYRVAEETSISYTTVQRIEEEKVKRPQIAKLQGIADYLGVPIEVFYDDYYSNIDKTESFIIGEQKKVNLPKDEKKRPIDLLNVAYEVEIKVNTKSTLSNFAESSLDQTVELTALDLEEFLEELTWLVERTNKRRLTWQSKKDAYERLTERGDDLNE